LDKAGSGQLGSTGQRLEPTSQTICARLVPLAEGEKPLRSRTGGPMSTTVFLQDGMTAEGQDRIPLGE
jgi:hypothetical protein